MEERQETISPVRRRMWELLAGQGPEGYAVSRLRVLLRYEGYRVARGTLHRWLAKDSATGLVRRPGLSGTVQSDWTWAGPDPRTLPDVLFRAEVSSDRESAERAERRETRRRRDEALRSQVFDFYGWVCACPGCG